MSMIRYTTEPLTGKHMVDIVRLWPGIRVTQVNKAPKIGEKWLNNFDSAVAHAKVVEIETDQSRGDTFKFIHGVLKDSEFIKRGGILIRAVSEDGEFSHYELIQRVGFQLMKLTPPEAQVEENVQQIPDLKEQLKELPAEPVNEEEKNEGGDNNEKRKGNSRRSRKSE